MAKSSIATAYVQVVPSAQGIKGSLSKQFGGEGTSAGSSFGSNLIGKISGMLATAGLGKMLTDTIMAGADLEQSLGGIATLFKDNAATVIQNSETAYQRAGMSANDYMGTVTSFSASLLQSVGGDTAQAASIADMALVDMADNANKMGTDIESIQNAYQGFAKQNYTMLDNLKLGYGGTKAEMQRLLADAEKLTGIKYDIKNLDDVYLAIHAIQKEMGIAGATAEEAEGTLRGSFNSMKAAFTDVLGNLTLGRDVKPSLIGLAKSTTAFLKDNLAPAVMNIITALPGAAATFLNEIIPEDVHDVINNATEKFTEYVTENMPTFLNSGIETLTTFIQGITETIPSLGKSASEILETLKNYLVDEANLEGLLSAGGDLLGTIAVGIINFCGDLATAAIEVLAALGEYLTDPENLEELLSKAGEIGGQIATAIFENMASVWGSLCENMPGLVAGLENFAAGGSDRLLGINGIPGHATGLDYVPFDNYVARLHKGEMVVPAREAAYLRGSLRAIGATGFGTDARDQHNGVTVNQYIYSEAKTAADLMEEAVYQQEKAVLLGV